jgi:hypothetical protein
MSGGLATCVLATKSNSHAVTVQEMLSICQVRSGSGLLVDQFARVMVTGSWLRRGSQRRRESRGRRTAVTPTYCGIRPDNTRNKMAPPTNKQKIRTAIHISIFPRQRIVARHGKCDKIQIAELDDKLKISLCNLPFWGGVNFAVDGRQSYASPMNEKL